MQARHQADGLGQFCGLGVWAGVLAADRLPTGAEARLRQAFVQQVHAVIGEHGQEQVGADAAGLDMENGTPAPLDPREVDVSALA